MTDHKPRPWPPAPERWPQPLRWTALAALSILFVVLLELTHLPAATLLGPMAAAVLLSISGGGVRLPGAAFSIAQAIVGVMIANGLPFSIFGEIARDWPVFLLGILSTVLAANVLGWMIARTGLLPGTTAIWGSAPGAATVMVVMSSSYGADMRLVAFMQYLRVFCCAIAAAVVAGSFGASTVDAAGLDWFPPLDWRAFAATWIVIGLSVWLGGRLRLPAAGLLLGMAFTVLARAVLDVEFALPPWLLALGYGAIGWAVGLRFTRDVVIHAAKLTPRLLLSIVTLLLVCAGFGFALSAATGVDPLTAYLATSPGGADSVAIIAASTDVDVPFVLSMQLGRFFFVCATGPILARLLSRAARS